MKLNRFLVLSLALLLAFNMTYALDADEEPEDDGEDDGLDADAPAGFDPDEDDDDSDDNSDDAILEDSPERPDGQEDEEPDEPSQSRRPGQKLSDDDESEGTPSEPTPGHPSPPARAPSAIPLGAPQSEAQLSAPRPAARPSRPQNPVLISRGKPVAQSTDAYGGHAHLAVDGNYNQNYFARTCTHTNYQVNPWWRVDLGQQHFVSYVKIWNRADCCGGRLNSLKVQTSDDTSNWRDAGSLNQHVGNGGVYTIQTHGAVGRFVRLIISKSQPEYLTLCEVEIYGSPTGGHVQPAHQPAPSGGHGHGHGGHHHHHHHRQQHHHRHHHHQPRRHHWLHHVVNFFRRG